MPEVVTGDPETDRNEGTDMPTEVTEPPVTAYSPSSVPRVMALLGSVEIRAETIGFCGSVLSTLAPVPAETDLTYEPIACRNWCIRLFSQ